MSAEERRAMHQHRRYLENVKRREGGKPVNDDTKKHLYLKQHKINVENKKAESKRKLYSTDSESETMSELESEESEEYEVPVTQRRKALDRFQDEQLERELKVNNMFKKKKYNELLGNMDRRLNQIARQRIMMGAGDDEMMDMGYGGGALKRKRSGSKAPVKKRKSAKKVKKAKPMTANQRALLAKARARVRKGEKLTKPMRAILRKHSKKAPMKRKPKKRGGVRAGVRAGSDYNHAMEMMESMGSGGRKRRPAPRKRQRKRAGVMAGGGSKRGGRTNNPWIEHVKQFAMQHNLPYAIAMQQARSTY